MSEWLTIWIVLIILYLQDCLVRHNGAGFFIVRSPRGRLKLADQTLFRSKKGLIAIGAFFPWEKLYAVQARAIAISPVGFSTIPKDGENTPCPVFLFSESADFKSLNDSILINHRVVFQCGSPAQAKKTAILLDRIKKLHPLEREEQITSELEKALDIESVRGHSRESNLNTANLRTAGVALWIILFLLFPILISIKASVLALGALFSIAGVLLVYVATEYYFCMRDANPSTAKTAIFSSIIQMILCPAIAPRASIGIDFQSFSDYHPLAVACGISQGEPNLVTNRLIRYTFIPSCESQINPVSHWFSLRLREVAKKQLENHCPHFLETAFKPPIKTAGGRSYCPRCHSQYATDRAHCSDCGGVSLIRFSQVVR